MTITPTTEFPEIATSLDVLLSSNARRPQDSLPGRELAAWAVALAAHPRRSGGRFASLAADLGKIAVGLSTGAPERKDARFADPAWQTNPMLRRTVQAYLATSEKALQLLDDASLSERGDHRVRLLVQNLIDALAPSNGLLNPAVMKATVDTGGGNLVKGARALVRDFSKAPRVPATVDPRAFKVGETVAATPGAVIYRSALFELIQYQPTTEQVRSVPIVIVPPTVNKFYVLDLSPGRSQIEHLLSEGQQVFAISWRNPSPRHAAWGIDSYVQSILDALEIAREITEAQQAVLYGVCSGGILASMAASHLFSTGRGNELAAFNLAVTVLDQARGGTMTSLLDRSTAAAAVAKSKRAGYLDGTALAEVFAWLRPNDVIWTYWVNNYLLGKTPPAFDILFWNSDTVRMPAKLHEDLMTIALDNQLVTAGEAHALGLPVDLGAITVDAYVVGGESDHITPWQGCYRTTDLLGGNVDFILSRSGHIAAMVNPPSNPKATYRHSTKHGGGAAQFKANAEQHKGSWWPHWTEWLSSRTGDVRPAPEELGRGDYQPLVTAPGTYVFDK